MLTWDSMSLQRKPRQPIDRCRRPGAQAAPEILHFLDRGSIWRVRFRDRLVSLDLVEERGALASGFLLQTNLAAEQSAEMGPHSPASIMIGVPSLAMPCAAAQVGDGVGHQQALAEEAHVLVVAGPCLRRMMGSSVRPAPWVGKGTRARSSSASSSGASAASASRCPLPSVASDPPSPSPAPLSQVQGDDGHQMASFGPRLGQQAGHRDAIG